MPYAIRTGLSEGPFVTGMNILFELLLLIKCKIVGSRVAVIKALFTEYSVCWGHCKLVFGDKCEMWVLWGQSIISLMYGNWSKRRQTETSTTLTSTNQNVDKPKRRQTETSTNQNVDKPKRRQPKTSTGENVDTPKRRQT